MSDGGGWITGPEMNFYRTLASGAPDPGACLSLQDHHAGVLRELHDLDGLRRARGRQTWHASPSLTLWPMGPEGFSPSTAMWIRSSSSNYDVWLNHFDANGNPAAGWPADGYAVCQLPHITNWMRKSPPMEAAVPMSRGEIVESDPVDAYLDIYLQRLNVRRGAASAGWPANGVAVHPNTPILR
jgi:hypothetical protein